MSSTGAFRSLRMRAGIRGVRFRMLDRAPDGKTRNRILAANPAELYGF